ncbi:MAG: Gfo/Idh/MocA family oxidoreductase [Burkholderiaceae bacterium]|nr:Gfo/Idh/MocA family oxidoreductase [Burkholderiaceae bacterium]
MSNSFIRWGIVGTGQIARAFAEGLRNVPDAALVAVASRRLDTAQEFAATFSVRPGAVKAHGSYEGLGDNPEVDAVYIATPHNLHAENALMCLHAGKAVLCEKPFTINRRQAREVVDLARHKKLFLMEAMWTRFLPAVREARRLLERGEIGEPRQVLADFGFCAEFDPTSRLFARELGGGALLDIGIYPLSIAAYLLGPIEQAQAQAVLADTGVDAQTAFSLRHRNGALSSCLCSITAATESRLIVSGSSGRIELHAPFFMSQALTITDNSGASRTINLPFLGNGYTHEAIEVGRCLRSGMMESPLMTLDESLDLMGWLDSMRAQCGVRYPYDDENGD